MAEDIPDKLHITDYAIEKALLYAEIVYEVTKKPYECYGYLLRKIEHDNPFLVTDVYFADNQIISRGEVDLEPIDIIRAGNQVEENGYEIIGWWHSHGRSGVFHSSKDDRNMLKILGAYESNTLERKVETCTPVVEGNKLIIDPFEIILEDISQIKAIKEIRRRRPKAFVYSMVVNLRREVYAELIDSEYCTDCNQQTIHPSNNVDLAVPDFKLKNYICIPSLVKDVQSRIRLK